MSTQEGVLPHHSSSLKTYLLAYGLPYSTHQLSLATGLNVPPPHDPIFEQIGNDLEQAYHRALRTSINRVDLKIIDTHELGKKLIQQANQLSHARDCNIVSTCPEIITQSDRVAALHVNRLVTFSGNDVGIGQRPGQPALHVQVDSLVKKADGNSYIIIEDGLFTGGTMCHVVKLLERAGARVVAIVAGFQFNKARQAIAALQDDQAVGHPIEVVSVCDFQPEMLVDWMPDHDHIPFIPNCGRVLGVNFGEFCVPYYSRNGTSYSIPYLSGYCRDLEDWTSIPLMECAHFSLTCLDLAIRLFQAIQYLNPGCELIVSDLINSQCTPRISLPIVAGDAQDVIGRTQETIRRGQEDPPTPNPPNRRSMPVLGFLHMMQRRLQTQP